MNVVKSIVLGFIAGALAALTALMVMEIVWAQTSFRPQLVFPAGLLSGEFTFVNDIVWGGIWGAIMGLVFGALPQGPLTFKGFLFGLIGPGLIGIAVLMLFPAIVGGGAGPDLSDVVGMLQRLVSAGVWGAAAGWLYGMFCYQRLPL